jgi:two-component system response regulator MprA
VAAVARVLVVDDDHKRGALLGKHLESQGFFTVAYDPAASVQPGLVLSASLDLLILRAPLAMQSAEEICLQFRDSGATIPILVIAESPHYGKRVAALAAGADDALGDPFALEELYARLHSLLRRARMGNRDVAGNLLEHRDLSLNTDDRQVSRAGKALNLTVKEYDLLLYLLRHKQQVLPRHQILTSVWGDTWVGDDNLLDVYIRYLRKKLDAPALDPLIHTVRGVGFMLK